MSDTVSNFHYGAVTPIAAYLMACLGAALGLRCTTRSMLRRAPGARRAGWLTLGAVSIGCGIWTMHFIAMMGFTIQGSLMTYDPALTVLSLVVAIAVVAVGIFLVGYRGASPATLGTAGAVTGLGVAAMHYMGMAAMSGHGSIDYDPLYVGLSILIAVVAATAALWAAVSVHGLWASVGASAIMGVAVTGMHYTGMTAVTVHVTDAVANNQSSASLLSFLLTMVAGPVVVLIIVSVIVMFDPEVVLGDNDWNNAQPIRPAQFPDAAAAPVPDAEHARPPSAW
ncbi:MHYT domain-containing protein [Streptomyces fructofermentans]|uniref:Membrane protein n=1 Tax=Streptomyces fructofermentans TaxID=152141 RepID=A0A918NIF1_9ACTN|nr:MHYT domain-containing protein [Streptomyces fructofermentans]GGX69851.1 membrane protein [Streptomyces fructofermentans]